MQTLTHPVRDGEGLQGDILHVCVAALVGHGRPASQPIGSGGDTSAEQELQQGDARAGDECGAHELVGGDAAAPDIGEGQDRRQEHERGKELKDVKDEGQPLKSAALRPLLRKAASIQRLNAVSEAVAVDGAAQVHPGRRRGKGDTYYKEQGADDLEESGDEGEPTCRSVVDGAVIHRQLEGRHDD